METRTIIVASTSTRNTKVVQSNDETWGQFKSRPELAGLILPGMDAVVDPGHFTLNRDDAKLPEGEFRLFLVPTKNKAGAGIPRSAAAVLSAEIGAAIYEASKKADENELHDLREAILETLADFYNIDVPDVSCPGCEQALEDGIAMGL